MVAHICAYRATRKSCVFPPEPVTAGGTAAGGTASVGVGGSVGAKWRAPADDAAAAAVVFAEAAAAEAVRGTEAEAERGSKSIVELMAR